MKHQSSNSPQPTTEPRSTPVVIKFILLAGCALAIYLFAKAMAFEPRGREYDGIFYLFASILVGAMVIWSFITWLAYRSMRASGRRKPARAALWILFLPLILLIASMGASWIGSIFSGGY